MKRILLLRHAKSDWDDPSLADYDRPLAKRGRRAARAMGSYLMRVGLQPDWILCSGARRAQETLELLREAWLGASGVAAGAESPEIVIEPDLYEARPADLLGRVGELPAEAASVLVIGHNPTVQQAAVDLAGTGSPEQYRRLKEEYPTAALASLLLAGADWSGVRPGAGELDLFVVPKDLPDD